MSGDKQELHERSATAGAVIRGARPDKPRGDSVTFRQFDHEATCAPVHHTKVHSTSYLVLGKQPSDKKGLGGRQT